MYYTTDYIKCSLQKYQYMMDPKKIDIDTEEFRATLSFMLDIFGDNEKSRKVDVSDTLEFICILKDFTDKIKPLAIKYGIRPYLKNFTGEDT